MPAIMPRRPPGSANITKVPTGWILLGTCYRDCSPCRFILSPKRLGSQRRTVPSCGGDCAYHIDGTGRRWPGWDIARLVSRPNDRTTVLLPRLTERVANSELRRSSAARPPEGWLCSPISIPSKYVWCDRLSQTGRPRSGLSAAKSASVKIVPSTPRSADSGCHGGTRHEPYGPSRLELGHSGRGATSRATSRSDGDRRPQVSRAGPRHDLPNGIARGSYPVLDKRRQPLTPQ